MSNKNETVEEALAAVRKKIHEWKFAWFWFKLNANTEVDRIESAWRREKAELIGTSDWTQCAICQTNKTGEGYGDIPPPVGDDDECDSCEIAKRLRSGKPRPRRNCDRFASGDDAFYAFDNECKLKSINPCRAGKNMCTGHDSIHCFKDWLFPPVAEGGESNNPIEWTQEREEEIKQQLYDRFMLQGDIEKEAAFRIVENLAELGKFMGERIKWVKP